jgi:hypothetical protein
VYDGGDVGENVLQENNDDVAMPDIALHEAVTQPVAIVNDVFRNTLADDTEHEDGIDQLLLDV